MSDDQCRFPPLALLRVQSWLSPAFRVASQGVPPSLALPAFVQSYFVNPVTAGGSSIPLGQTDGQLAIAELEEPAPAASAQAEKFTIDDLGSAAFMVDSRLHGT